MISTLTIHLDAKLDKALAREAKRTGRPKSQIAREALRRHLSIIRFEEARRVVQPFAEARGLLTDEDTFDAVS